MTTPQAKHAFLVQQSAAQVAAGRMLTDLALMLIGVSRSEVAAAAANRGARRHAAAQSLFNR